MVTIHVSANLHAQQLSALVAGVAANVEASAGGIAADRKKECWLKARHVPYIFAVHDCISDIASGMTVKWATLTQSPDASLRLPMQCSSLRPQHLQTTVTHQVAALAGCCSSSDAPGLMSLRHETRASDGQFALCRFLPIWYREGMRLSPAATGLLEVAMPATMALLALCVQPVSKRIGTWVLGPANVHAGGQASRLVGAMEMQTVRACTSGQGSALVPTQAACLPVVMCIAKTYADHGHD